MSPIYGDRETALKWVEEYAEKALEAAQEYSLASHRYRDNLARDVTVYSAAATAMAAALQTGAIR